MKKIVLAVVFALSMATLVWAQDQKPADTKEMPGMAAKGGSKCCSMMGDKGMMGKGMMMHAMMPKQMVASNDGGVIVLSGNKLYKYDKNLTLVKEAEVKVDMDAMKNMMAKCPMMKHDEKAEKAEGAEEPGDDMGDMPMPAK